MHLTRRLALVIAAMLAASEVLAQPPAPCGGEFQVNTYTSLNQSYPAVAVDADGDFVVVWRGTGSTGDDSSSFSVQGQRFGSDGSFLGDEFQVNTYTSDDQASPAVAVDADGDFVVVWHSLGSAGDDSSYRSVQGQRYGSDGSPHGGEFQVNTYTTSFQVFPTVAVGADGDFVVVWHSLGSTGTDSSSFSIQGQRFSSDGSLLGGEFQVNTYTTGEQVFPAVAVDTAGNFVVVWRSDGSVGGDSSNHSVQGQRFGSDGSPLGGEFQVNTYTTGTQGTPAVAVDADGDFVVVWQSLGSAGDDSSGYSVQGQRYDSEGSLLGDEFQVNSYTTNFQKEPWVAGDAEGDFVVVWFSFGSEGDDSSSYSIQGQRYNSDGSLLGGEFQVNSYTTDSQKNPAVAVDADGDFVVVWQSLGSAGDDSSNHSVQGQRFGCAEIFADGFESGDLSTWSSSVGR